MSVELCIPWKAPSIARNPGFELTHFEVSRFVETLMKKPPEEMTSEEIEAREKTALNRLLSTPPQPKAKQKEGEPAKKRGRPPKKTSAP